MRLACAFLVLLASVAIADPLPTPTTQPVIPDGEKPWYDGYRGAIASARHWVVFKEGSLQVFDTSESAGDGAAMRLYLPANAAKSGWLTGYDTGCQPTKDKDGNVTFDPFKEFKGICLWVKGDGSDAELLLGTGNNVNQPIFRIPLKDKDWKKVHVPWNQFKPAITGHFWFLNYSIERKDNTKATSCIIDRVHYFREAKTEAITPTRNQDPPGNIPAKQFTSGREQIAKTLAKLKAKQPVKIVVAGDSMVTAAQLWYLRDDYTKPEIDTYPYTFWAVLCGRLAKTYGYEKSGFMLRTYNDEKKAWFDTATTRPAEGGLQVIAVARGGWEAKQGLEHIQQVLDEKPDLVIWEYGGNEAINGHMNDYANIPGYISNTTAAVKKLKEANIEVVLQTITTSCDVYPQNWLKMSIPEYSALMSEQTRKIAKENASAIADQHNAMKARGLLFLGSLHSDFVHMNHFGHELWADVLEALLTDNDVKTWRHVPPTD